MASGNLKSTIHEKQAIVMDYTTGLPAGRFAAPLIRLREEGVKGRPPSPGLRNTLQVTLKVIQGVVLKA